jgi:hypothetical protein
MLALLAVLAGCAATPFADRYTPGATEVVLWGSESIPIGPEWRFIGEEQASVRGKIRDTTLTPVDFVQTLVFVQEGEGPASILLLSRVIKTAGREVFVFLDGDKTELGGREYRESLYYLSSSTTDPEYRRYLAKVSDAGVTLASSYRVRVMDRLPVDTVLTRVMELTPGEGTSQLPPFARLYPQERLDPIIRGFR